MPRRYAFLLSLLLCFWMRPLLAYNFLYIHPTSKQPIGWEPGTTIRYKVDPGPLGRLSNAQALRLVQEAMLIWENASPYANVPHFVFDGYLDQDIDETNYQNYVSGSYCFENSLSSCNSASQRDLQTVIIFDDDGSIVNNELCPFTSCYAFGGAGVFSGNSSNPQYITQGILVIDHTAYYSNVNGLVGLLVHELGHMLGLAHPYLNQQVFYTRNDWKLLSTMELMAGGALSQESNDAVTLNPDDIAGITTLYPTSAASRDLGVIKGEIFKSDGASMQYINVIARNIEDPACEVYSFVSGRMCPEETHGSDISGGLCIDNNIEAHYLSGSGFIIKNLSPATYTIEVEEFSDQNLANVIAPGVSNSFIFGDSEFWNENDQANEPNTLFSTITLAAGETRDNINIVLNRSTVTEDRIKYLPLSTFTPGPATRCPSEPPVNYAAMIGVNEGTAGSGGGDSSSSSGGCSLIQTE